MASSEVRTRYAPSPTGPQHIGGLRTALYNFLYARHHHGTFIVRVEDTDRERYVAGSEHDIAEALTWIGIEWNEGYQRGGPHAPYQQSQRLALYTHYAETLVASGAAYLAYDPPSELAHLREQGSGYDRRGAHRSPAENRALAAAGVLPVVRFRTPLHGAVAFTDLILGSTSRKCADVAVDPVLIKSDGYPTYHLASVVDDHLMDITHVLRAQEWLSSTALHHLLYRAFDWSPPHFAHLPPITASDGKKLSKRHGATAALELREKGYLPSALCNYLALLGWAYDDRRERFSTAELIEAFTLDGIQRAPARFNAKKLDWHNRRHIQELPLDRFTEMLYSLFATEEGAPLTPERRAQIATAAPFIQPRIANLRQAPQWIAFCINAPSYEYRTLLKGLQSASTARAMVHHVERALNSLYTDPERAGARLQEIAQQNGYEPGALMGLIRYALTGSTVSLPVGALLTLLPIEESRARIASAGAHITASASAARS